jgi:4-hydroxy-tetrahydrodipicolinate reductase
MHRLALVGYGKMGKMIDPLAGEYGLETALRLDEYNNENGAGMTPENFQGIDIAIEFSTPSTVVDNITRLVGLGVPVVVGTTGWLERLDQVRKLVSDAGGGLVWSPNFSIGVNVFARLVSEAARLLASEPAYGAWAWEIHHSTKKDAPSGTLHMLVEQMKGAGYARLIDASSNRAGAHPGTHEIGFDSAADTITLRHAARSREGFARGALKAAAWLVTNRTGFYEFKDILFT